MASASDGIIQRDVKFVMGHLFEEHSWRNAKGYCEKCNGVIIAIVQTWRKCSGTLSHFYASLSPCVISAQLFFSVLYYAVVTCEMKLF